MTAATVLAGWEKRTQTCLKRENAHRRRSAKSRGGARSCTSLVEGCRVRKYPTGEWPGRMISSEAVAVKLGQSTADHVSLCQISLCHAVGSLPRRVEDVKGS